MKIAYSLSLSILLSSPASAAASSPDFVTATVQGDRIWLVDHFSDSTFDYSETAPDPASKAICFNGPLESACARLEKQIADQLEARDPAEHDYLEFQGCATGTYSIEATYQLSDDYSQKPLDVVREIASCESAAISAGEEAVAGATELYQAWAIKGEVTVAKGFYPSFGYFHNEGGEPKNGFCYRGRADDVCALAKKDADLSIAAYQNGDHSYVDVLSCTVSANTVLVDYRLSNDYEDDVTASDRIQACLH